MIALVSAIKHLKSLIAICVSTPRYVHLKLFPVIVFFSPHQNRPTEDIFVPRLQEAQVWTSYRLCFCWFFESRSRTAFPVVGLNHTDLCSSSSHRSLLAMTLYIRLILEYNILKIVRHFYCDAIPISLQRFDYRSHILDLSKPLDRNRFEVSW